MMLKRTKFERYSSPVYCGQVLTQHNKGAKILAGKSELNDNCMALKGIRRVHSIVATVSIQVISLHNKTCYENI